MADQYSIVGTYETDEFLGGTATRAVVVVRVRTKPHNVYFEARTPKKGFTAEIAADVALGYAVAYEALFAYPGLVDAEWGQRPTAAGELEDTVTVYVESSSGASQGSLVFPYSQFSVKVIPKAVAALRAQLDATEEL